MGSKCKRNILGGKKILEIMFWALVLSSCATTIDGRISAEDSQAGTFKDAAVNLSYLNESKSEGSFSSPLNESGEYKISGDIKPGEYLLEVLVPGHEYVSRRVQLEGSQTIDLKIKKIQTAGEKNISTYENLPIGRGSGRAILSAPQL